MLTPAVLGFSLRRDVSGWASLKGRLMDGERGVRSRKLMSELAGCDLRPALEALLSFLGEQQDKA